MKKMVVVVAAMAMSFAASGIRVVGRSRGARLGEGRRLDATMVDRAKPKASTNAVVVVDGVWKEKPGGLFGKKFGEMIPAKVVLSGGRGERSVTFQPEQRFESPDGSLIRFDRDYFGDARGIRTVPGPFVSAESLKKKVW